MTARTTARLGALVGALAVAAATMMSGASPAAAADSFSFRFTELSDNKSGVINVNNNTWGESAGNGWWRADPIGGSTGDTLIADDVLPDGYGIEAHLSTGRVASTAGHSSPYSKEVSGNLTEGNTYQIWVCVVKGSFSKCSSKFNVKA
ncbi:hypothetical protein [Streptomyces sp. 35G-GA-8]|uniref:hypothetical protein n=1 Tax=Streptomyces sp. 35G-GA-8 TaxID=2939434 RepID=UPI00201F564E|nr:hypothetical protein [Streptomyces sp. 35G-GA-8]MCL7382443.1 hypothetical protein [Streptomyces sp. 35G-GA-8]